MTVYEKFKHLHFDCSLPDLIPGDAHSEYCCTPAGAEVIGWAGVDGIHYCFVDGFGEMVFAVNPSNLPEAQVHPLARNFEDFLRLLLACNGLAAAEQAHLWDRDGFNACLWESDPPDPAQQAALDALRDRLSLTPMDDPYGYIKEVQSSFDYSKIPYRADYYSCIPEGSGTPERPKWNVYFASDFGCDHVDHDKPGKEIPIHKTFTWGGRIWHVPAVYACAQGLVIDFCMEIAPADLQAFLDKWTPRLEEDIPLTPEEEDRQMAENPTTVRYTPELTVNGNTLRRCHGTGFGWVPVSCRPGQQRGKPHQADWESLWLMEHYGLDPRQGWMFCRDCFPWESEQLPVMKTLALSLKADAVPVPGPRFTVSGAGDCIPFVHPVTGETHTLRVMQYEAQEMDTSHFQDNEKWDYPTHYIALSCVTDPALPHASLTIRDCGKGDSPRLRQCDPAGPTVACSVGIIGGADGPTVMLLANGKTGRPHAACSALYFALPEQIEWRLVFYAKPTDDMQLDLFVS